MLGYIMPAFLFVGCVWYPVSAGTEQQMRALMDAKLNTTGYSSRVRPIADTGNVMQLKVDMYLIGINDVDEVEQKLTSTAYLRVSWNDTFLTWTPADYGNIDKIYLPQERIWKPDLALSNAFDSITGLGDKFMYLTVDYVGVIEWQPYQVFESTCELDMTFFPFDKQTCDLEMVTWSSTREMIQIVTGTDGFNIDNYEKNANWELLSVSTLDTSTSTTSAMSFRMNIKRKPLYFLINFIFPIILLSILNVFVFILPCDSGEKTGYAMVLFLSFAIFLLVVTDIMPEGMKTVPVLSTYLLLMCVFSTIYVFIVIIELRFHNLGEDVQIPGYMRAFTNFVNVVKRKLRLTCSSNKKKEKDSDSDTDIYEKALDKKIKQIGGDAPEVSDKDLVKNNKLSRRSSLVKDLLYNRKVTPSQVFNINQPDAVDRPYEDKDMQLEDADGDLFEDNTNQDKAQPTTNGTTKGTARDAKTPKSVFSTAKHQNLVKDDGDCEIESDDRDPAEEDGNDEMTWTDVTSAMDNFFFVFSIVLNGLTTVVAVLVAVTGDE